MAKRRPFPLLMSLLLGLWCASAHAHGINSHVHVTGWTLENLPPGPLADFFAEPEVFDALLLGSVFPDSGYAIEDAYGEMAHWSPFAEGALADLRTRYPLPWDTLEARRHAAFVMGIALHGLQDEIFDTLFLRQAEHHDGATQDDTDGGLDAILFSAGHLRFLPEYYVPAQALSEIFADSQGHTVSPATIEAGVTRVKLIVIDAFAGIAPTLEADSRANLTWSIDHCLDPAVPGSFVSEIAATEAYLQALWARFHPTAESAVPVVHVYPEAPRRLRSAVPDGVDHWISLILSGGARVSTLTPDRIRLKGPDERQVSVRLRPNRWAHTDDSSTRMVVIEPLEALEFDTEYTVEVLPGLGFFNGAEVGPWVYTIRTPCPLEAPCPDPEVTVPSIIGPMDASAGRHDAGVDALPAPSADLGSIASNNVDTGTPDTEGAASEGCATNAHAPAPSPWFSLLFGITLCATRKNRHGRDRRAPDVS